jgi:sugar lactone lactonase YvrE
LLYVSDLNNGPGGAGEIIVYTANLRAYNPQPIRTITNGADHPFGIWVDSAGTLYVVNQVNGGANSSVTEFHPGDSTPFLTIKDGLALPQTVAVDSSGTVYVNDSYNGGQIEVYAAGSTHLERTIAVGRTESAVGLAFGRGGNLLAAYQLAQERLRIYEIAPGSSQPQQLNLNLRGLSGPGIGVDGAGNLYVGSQSSGTVAMFLPGQTEPLRTITDVGAYGLLTSTRGGALYVASGFSYVSEIAAGSSTPTNYVNGPTSSLLRGVAISP